MNVLSGMFAGDAPHEAIAAQEDAAHADGRQHVPPAGWASHSVSLQKANSCID